MLIIFWIALGVLLFTYFGYPLCLMIISKFAKELKYDESYSPLVSLIVPVYNEEKIIERKIKNSLSLDYPKEKLEIIIASDGSTDKTEEIVEKYLSKGIKYFSYRREGKLATINKVVPQSRGEILVFTDASAYFNNKAIKKLVGYFVNKDVGVVSGVDKIKTKNNAIDIGESWYWTYETEIKKLEGRIFSSVGANGPIYAIKKSLFPSIPSHLNLCDDMAISLHVVERGKRIILQPEATALEDASLNLKDEWRRKVRISTQAWQTLAYYKNLLIPFLSNIAFQLIFHKLLRWLSLVFMLIIFVSNFFIFGLFYKFVLILQIIVYLFSAVGIFLLSINIKCSKLLALLGYFMFTNFIQVVGFYNSIFNKGKPIWQPIERAD